MNFLTEDQVSQLAPDGSSLKAGKDLANERKWLNYQSNERVLWGEVQGSGKDPYRTQIDLQNTAFKCSCPSRKFPCKHGLGLLFLVARRNGDIPQLTTEPSWVSEWINKRSEKAEAKIQPPVSEEQDSEKTDKQAKDKEKRQNERLLKVEAGIAELDLWLRDMVRGGLLTLPEKGNAYFEKMAARMVDAQATGFASLVKEFTKINYYKGDSWQPQALEIAAKIHLQIEAFRNLDQLPPLVQEEIKSRVGWNVQQKELLENKEAETIDDEWVVIGRRTTQEEDIVLQRNWLYGSHSRRFALVLNFAYKTAAIETPLVPGNTSKARLVFYPSHSPFRALIKHHLESKTFLPTSLEGVENWQLSQVEYTRVIAQNPWADDVPQLVEQLQITKHQAHWYLQDTTGAVMRLHDAIEEAIIWKLLAYTAGHPTTLFLLRQSTSVWPLGIVQNFSYQLL